MWILAWGLRSPGEPRLRWAVGRPQAVRFGSPVQLAVRAKVLGVTHKATSIALEKAREAINHHKDVGKKSTREKKEAALSEYSERLAQHKRAKSEFENTINLVTSSMYDVVDPGSQTHAKDGMSRYELEKRMQKETPQLGKSRSI